MIPNAIEMQHIGGAIKIGYKHMKDPRLVRDADSEMINGRFLDARKMAQEMGLPILKSADVDTAINRADWALTYVSRCYHIQMPYVVHGVQDGTGYTYVSWEE